MPSVQEEIEDILVDCYDEFEQMSAWEVAFTESVAVPFAATLLGTSVQVQGFRANGANALQCQVVRGDKQRWLGVEDLDEEGLPTDCLHLLTLYHAWVAGEY